MRGLGESIFKEGWEEGFRQGWEEGFRQGREEGFRQGREEVLVLERNKIIRNLICYDLKDHISADCIIQKIQNYFDVSREMAEQYFQKFTPHSIQE